jgi:copper transport protein
MWSCGKRAKPRSAAALLGGALLWLVLLPHPAAAHAVLIGSDPPDGATAASAPAAVQLRFSEDISARFSSARLVDADGRPVAGGRSTSPRGDSRLLVLELPALKAGSYGVLWQALAETDGHTTHGVVVFSVGAGSAPRLARGSATAGAGAALRPADVVRRWVGIALLAGLIGALAVAGLVLGRAAAAHPAGPLAEAIRVARRRLLVLAACCAALGAAAGVGDALAEAARQASEPGAWRATVVDLLTGTRWGRLWLAREVALIGLALLAVRLRAAIGRTDRRHARALAAAAGALVLVAVSVEALGSHAASLEGARAAAVAVGALHILTACLWLGALPALALMLWPQRVGGPGPGDLLMAGRRAFTALAATSVGLVVASGLYSAGREIGPASALLTTTYGRALLVKSALLLVVGGLGLVNSVQLHARSPGWLGKPGRRLAARWPSRRRIVLEAGVGAMLLLAVGVLLETAPPREPATAVAPPAPAAAETASGSVEDLVVTVSVTPNRPGVNGFTVLAASSRRPPPAPVDGVTLQLAGASAGGEVVLEQVAPGRWFGTGSLDHSGGLRLRAVVQRAGRRLGVPVSWWVAQPAPAPPHRVVRASGPRLAPYADAMALALLAGALAAGAWWLLVTRRGRRPPAAVEVEAAKSPERVLRGAR